MDVKKISADKIEGKPFESNFKVLKDPESKNFEKFYHDIKSPKPFRKTFFREDLDDYKLMEQV